MLRLGVELVAARDGADLHAALLHDVASNQLVERYAYSGLPHPRRVGKLFVGDRLVGCVDDLVERAFEFSRYDRQLYCSSISFSGWLSGSPPAKTTSNILCLRSRISPNSCCCTITTACSRTSSSTARNATIMAWREGQASKNTTSRIPSSLVTRCSRNCSIICATVNCSCCSSILTTSRRRSSTCWNTLTRSTSETTSSPSASLPS